MRPSPHCRQVARGLDRLTASSASRLPARKGFPFKTLYHEFRTSLDKGKYRFVRGGHVYFGKRKEIELFGEKVLAS